MTPERRLKSMPISCQGIYKAAMTGRSRAKGVKAFCQECMGYERKLVRNCSDTGCPLYPYRPHKAKDFDEGEKEGEEEITVTTTEESTTSQPPPAPPVPTKKKKVPPKTVAEKKKTTKKTKRRKGRFSKRK